MTGFSSKFLRGVELLNQGKYFEAHEMIEFAWRYEPGNDRQLYQGILQVAVVYLHIERGNYPGARKVIKRALANLTSVMLDERVNTKEIIDYMGFLDRHLSELPAGKLSPIDPSQFVRVKLHQ